MARAGLRVVGGPGKGRAFEVEDAIELGRGAPGSPEFSDPLVSRRHARLSIDPAGRLTIVDLGSSNGTLVNGRVLTGVETLAIGDVIDMGDTTLEVVDLEPVLEAPAAQASATEAPPKPARSATRSRSIAAGLPVLSSRALVKTVRIRGAIVALAVTAVLWLVLYVQLKNGDDPGLKKSAALVQPTTGGSSQTTTTISPTTATTTTAAS